MEKEYQGKLEVQSINAPKCLTVAKQYGVRSVPVQVFYDSTGNAIYRHQGFIARADILKAWKELGLDLTEYNASR